MQQCMTISQTMVRKLTLSHVTNWLYSIAPSQHIEDDPVMTYDEAARRPRERYVNRAMPTIGKLLLTFIKSYMNILSCRPF